jgi:hypothetical protein
MRMNQSRYLNKYIDSIHSAYLKKNYSKGVLHLYDLGLWGTKEDINFIFLAILDIVTEIVVPFQEIPNFVSNIIDVLQFSVYANKSFRPDVKIFWSNFKPLRFCNSLLKFDTVHSIHPKAFWSQISSLVES